MEKQAHACHKKVESTKHPSLSAGIQKLTVSQLLRVKLYEAAKMTVAISCYSVLASIWRFIQNIGAETNRQVSGLFKVKSLKALALHNKTIALNNRRHRTLD